MIAKFWNFTIRSATEDFVFQKVRAQIAIALLRVLRIMIRDIIEDLHVLCGLHFINGSLFYLTEQVQWNQTITQSVNF